MDKFLEDTSTARKLKLNNYRVKPLNHILEVIDGFEAYQPYIAGGIAVLTLLVDIVCWIYIPKWRTFRNYVFSDMTVSFTASFAVELVNTFSNLPDPILFILMALMDYQFLFSFCCWMVVMALTIYFDQVVMFKSDMTRALLKSNLFAWGMPVLITFVKLTTWYAISLADDRSKDKHDLFTYKLMETVINCSPICMLMLVNMVFFLRVTYCLIRNMDYGGLRRRRLSRRRSSLNVGRRPVQSPAPRRTRCDRANVALWTLVLASIMLIVSLLTSILAEAFLYTTTGKGTDKKVEKNANSSVIHRTSRVIYKLQMIIVNVFFLMLGSNRQMMYVLYKDKLDPSKIDFKKLFAILKQIPMDILPWN